MAWKMENVELRITGTEEGKHEQCACQFGFVNAQGDS